MKSRWPFLILVSLLGLCLLWVLTKKDPTTDNIPQEEVSADAQTSNLATTGAAPNSSFPSHELAQTPSTENDPGALAVPFENRLQEIADCLKIKPGKPDEDSTDMDFFSLNSALAEKFGGYRDEDDLWASTELKTPSGEHRRLLIDFREGQPALRYVVVQPDGSQKNIELTPEQSNEPSEALIASLESDGQVTGRARARVVNYAYGQQLTLQEIDGKIYSYKLSQGDKVYSCQRPTKTGVPNCSCGDKY
ncbi:hypothetical protein [Bdellovibrio sp. HCB2-146]|uniref:hypothetical protein n=1 Tax=Bdellovibrio sp. HCB2-146 TaxID=3394362 RepID=UPI0039BD8DDF